MSDAPERSISKNTQALCDTYRGYASIGRDIVPGPRCRVIRNHDAPDVYDANFLEVGPESAVESALAFLDVELAERTHRSVRTDPFSPPEFDADLTLRDFIPDPTIQLLLDGELLGPRPKDCDIRRVQSEADWTTLSRLFRADHLETDRKRGTSIFSPSLTKQIVANNRLAQKHLHFFMAWDKDEAVAFFSSWFSSWPGTQGGGMVEDLFTLPSHRNRGIARALIHQCVGDARARGADRVLIGAEVDETPKDLYAAMGFRATCITTSWTKTVSR